MPDTFIEVIQEVKNNLQGTVIGVEVGEVKGDLIEVKLFSLDGGADRASVWNRILNQLKPEPYKFLEPYTATDKKIFFGRDAEITEVMSTILRQRLLVIYGRAGVGKTSLIEAGVIPPLIQEGAMVLQIRNYAEPVAAVRKALKATAERTGFQLEDGKEAEPKSNGGGEPRATRTLFLVLDQFELVFDPSVSDAQRERFIDDLIGLLDALPPESLKVIILARDDPAVKGKVAELQGRIRDLLDRHMLLMPLQTKKAEEAISGPLNELEDKVSFPKDDGRMVSVLADELDRLTEKEPGVYPPHLQIVCHELRMAALRRERPYLIDEELYGSMKGAEGILASYMEKRLDTQLSDVKEEALQVLSQMASPNVEQWVSPDVLRLKDVPADEMSEKVSHTLERLVTEKLLLRQRGDGRLLYGFSDQETAIRARRLSGTEVALRYQADDEMKRVWAAWLARDVLASRGQLRYLAAFGTHLDLPAIRVLFLLRSAVERDEPTQVWLKRLRTDEGANLVGQLEGGSAASGSKTLGPSVLKQAEFLLTDSPKPIPSHSPEGEEGTPEVQPPNADEAAGRATKQKAVFKSVSENAVTYPVAAARQASALALTALGETEAVELLDKAIRDKLSGPKSIKRRAELRGALIDADAGNESLSKGLSWYDRPLVWSWRASRRVARNRERMGKLALYGAVGAALAVGLLRVLITFPGNYQRYTSPGVQFNAAFYFTAVCVLALLFGMTLAESLLTPHAGGGDPVLTPAQAAPRGSLRTAATIVGVGALMFGVANVIMMMFNQFSLDVPPQTIAPGLVIGLGFGAALYARLRGGRRGRAGAWLLSLCIGASVLALTQLYFNVFRVFSLPPTDPSAPSFFLVWNGTVYRDLFDWASWPLGWLDALAVIDAAALGAATTVGATLGMEAADISLAKSLSSPNRISD